MSESKVQQKIRNYLNRQGWLVVKIITCSLPGWPDLMAMRSGRLIIIEVKAPGEKPSPLQLARHNQLRQAGFEVHVIDDASNVEKVIESI